MKNSERSFMTYQACVEIKKEMEDSEDIFGSFHSLHEAIGVIREAYLKLEEAIFGGMLKNPTTIPVRSQAIQLAARTTQLIVSLSPVPDVPHSLSDTENDVT
jgi:hypothetical protein